MAIEIEIRAYYSNVYTARIQFGSLMGGEPEIGRSKFYKMPSNL